MKRYWLGVMGTAVALGLFMMPVHAHAEDITSMVANAKTASDHEAIAKHFDEVAADCTAKAEEHNNLITAASNQPRSLSSTDKHCNKMIEDLKDCAKQASDLAAAHRKMAADAK